MFFYCPLLFVAYGFVDFEDRRDAQVFLLLCCSIYVCKYGSTNEEKSCNVLIYYNIMNLIFVFTLRLVLI